MNGTRTFSRIAVGLIAAILVLTVLEFPAPVGFEVRPQDNVSRLWLFLFLAILISEIAAIPYLLKKPRIGAKLGLTVETHLMQPEVAPLGYLLLENAVGFLSIILGYYSWRILQSHDAAFRFVEKRKGKSY